jgi:hypothetical protein
MEKMNTSKPKFPWLYLLLAYGLTWLLWIPVAPTRQDYQTSPILFAVMLLVAAFFTLPGLLRVHRGLRPPRRNQ